MLVLRAIVSGYSHEVSLSLNWKYFWRWNNDNKILRLSAAEFEVILHRTKRLYPDAH